MNAKQFRNQIIKACRKHKPGNITVREYMKMYITSCYPLVNGLNYWDSITENPAIVEDFGIGINQLINRFTAIYNRVYDKPIAVAESKKVTHPDKKDFDFCQFNGEFYFFGYIGKSVQLDDIYHKDELSKKWLNDLLKSKKQTQLNLFL